MQIKLLEGFAGTKKIGQIGGEAKWSTDCSEHLGGGGGQRLTFQKDIVPKTTVRNTGVFLGQLVKCPEVTQPEL